MPLRGGHFFHGRMDGFIVQGRWTIHGGQHEPSATTIRCQAGSHLSSGAVQVYRRADRSSMVPFAREGPCPAGPACGHLTPVEEGNICLFGEQSLRDLRGWGPNSGARWPASSRLPCMRGHQVVGRSAGWPPSTLIRTRVHGSSRRSGGINGSCVVRRAKGSL